MTEHACLSGRKSPARLHGPAPGSPTPAPFSQPLTASNCPLSSLASDGIDEVKRDTTFDNEDFFSAGIRLHYKKTTEELEGLREGVLLELGFDDVIPNIAKDISSWAYDYAIDKVDIIDNRARDVACYDPRCTFVEKLQTISTKYRKQQESGESPAEFMRHYYDVYCLLDRPEVQAFIGTDAYAAHKEERFRARDNKAIAENQAFVLSDPDTRKLYARAFAASTALYYGTRPTFEQILGRISAWIGIALKRTPRPGSPGARK